MSNVHPLDPPDRGRPLASVTPLPVPSGPSSPPSMSVAAADRGAWLATCEEAWTQRFGSDEALGRQAELVAQVRDLAEMAGDEFVVAAADVFRMRVEGQNERLGIAIAGLVTATSVLETYPTSAWLGRGHGVLADTFAELNEDARALEHYRRQREVGEELEDLELQAGAANNIALIMAPSADKLEAFREAEALFARASVEHESSSAGGVVARLNGALTNIELGLIAAAVEQLPHVVEMARSLGRGELEALALASYGRCIALGGDPGAGVAVVEQALEIAAGLPATRRHDVDVECAAALSDCERPDLAIALLETPAVRSDPKLERRETALACLAAAYAATGEHELAYRRLHEAEQISARRTSDEAVSRIDAMRIYHRTRSAERELSSQLDLSARLLDHVATLSEQHEEAKGLAIRDDLTGLPNRRYLDLELRWRCSQRLPGGGVLVLVLVTIDDYDELVDCRGTEAAERLVVLASQLVCGTVRSGDAVARFATDTFAVVQSHRSPDAARFAAERLRQAVAGFPWADHQAPTATASVGVGAQAPPTAPGRLVTAASAAVLKARVDGGDCVRLGGG